MSRHAMLCCNMLCYVMLRQRFLRCLILCCLVLSYLSLSCLVMLRYITLHYSMLHLVVLSYLVLSYLNFWDQLFLYHCVPWILCYVALTFVKLFKICKKLPKSFRSNLETLQKSNIQPVPSLTHSLTHSFASLTPHLGSLTHRMPSHAHPHSPYLTLPRLKSSCKLSRSTLAAWNFNF